MRMGSMGTLAVILAALVLWTGCSTTTEMVEVEDMEQASVAPPAPAPAEKKESEEDRASKRKSLERKMDIAEARLKHAHMEFKIHEINSMVSQSHAEKELAMAKDKLAQFQTLDKSNKLARKELDLQRAQDGAKEAQEELEQLKIMYKDKDLDDLTREFVISRGKRRAEQRDRSLAIQENEIKSFREHDLVREERNLQLDVAKKSSALEKMALSNESSTLQKKIAIMNVESEIAGLKDQMEKLEEKGK
jgi:hypothetical protein